MQRVAIVLAIVGVCLAASLVPGTASAQERASIVGQVKDSTGAVMPGVTVEASSPALIEKVRSVVTDSAGRYGVIDLRPGIYVVTFSLPGFKTVRREGIELAGAFAATVNADLEVGALEETVTVSGASPVVDLHSTQNQFIVNREILDTLPAARTMQGGASLVPGVSYYSQGFVSVMSVHGSSTADQHFYFDGMKIGQNLTGTGSQASGTGVNDLGQEELVYDAGSQSAETAIGGVRMDSIPKEGGNLFSGVWRTFWSTGALQNDNVTPQLRPFIEAGDKLDFSWNTNAAVGGPIRKDKLWYFAAWRLQQTNSFVANMFWPDGRQVDRGGRVSPHETLRLTYQATPRNKFSVAYYNTWYGTARYDVGGAAGSGNVVAITEPEAAYDQDSALQYSAQAKWQSPVTNRLLFEAQQSFAVSTFMWRYQPDNGPFDVQHRESTTGRRSVASATAPVGYFSQIWNTVANLSYVTGSHAFKAGVNHEWGYSTTKVEPHGDMVFLGFTNGISRTVTVRNSPYQTHPNLNADLGLFAQDRWTLNRLTLSYGGRYDYFNASTPHQSAPAGRFVPARDVAAVPCIPCQHDWSLRVGASYNLFGTGKTALKTSVGKFLASQALGGVTGAGNPLQGQTESRSWNDLDGNGRALDANGHVQYEEIGPTRNANFGVPAGATKIDPNIQRGTNWEESVSVQQELLSGVSLTAGYYRRQFYNLEVTRNLLVDPDRDYTPFTIISPLNGERVTQYNLNLNKFQQVDEYRTNSPSNTRVYNGFEVSINARLPRGGFAFGGVTTERLATNTCDVADPNNRRFCDRVPPFQTLYKASAGYRLPYGVQLSGTFQARPGISIGSDYTFDGAVAGIALTGGGTRTVTLIDPTSQYYPYVTTTDTQVSKTFRVGGTRVRGVVEVFNLLNASTILTVSETVGPIYMRPQAIMQGRRAQVGAQLEF